ncbi:hypothetical protein BCT97_019495, partial [Vibrio breoganii]
SKQLERTLVNYINSQVSEKIARSIFDDNQDSGSINVSDGLNLDYEKNGDILTINISGENGDQNIELSVPGILEIKMKIIIIILSFILNVGKFFIRTKYSRKAIHGK